MNNIDAPALYRYCTCSRDRVPALSRERERAPASARGPYCTRTIIKQNLYRGALCISLLFSNHSFVEENRRATVPGVPPHR